jgi:outer membrane protein assembly complex protein YaeT
MSRRLTSAIALAFLAALAGACGSRGAQETTSAGQPILDDIRFEGITRFSHKELTAVLFLDETGPWPWSTDRRFEEALLPVDTQRIEAMYQAHGYYDAKVVGVSVLPKKDGKKVDVLFSVTEGSPTRIETLRIFWNGPGASGALRAEIEKTCKLRTGETFEVPGLNGCVSSLLAALQNRGFARAVVSPDAAVDRRQRTADVTITVEPGPMVRVGSFRLQGLSQVPEHLVRNELDFALGQLVTPHLVQSMERAVYGMEVFRTVEIDSSGSLTNDGRVELTVSVSEAQPQSLKLGLGLGLEPNRWEQRLTALYTHKDIFGQLTRLDLRLRAGYAELPMPFNMQEHGPVALLEPRITKKGWVEKRLVWSYAPGIELNVAEGYKYYSPRGRVSVSRFFYGLAQAELSHNLKFLDFFDISPTLDANRTLLGLDFRDPYTLSNIELDTRLYLTDQILEPRNGVILSARYTLAGGFLGGDFDYHKVETGLRAYWQIVSRLQIALRLETAFILPYGDQPGAPIDGKLYLGGADSVRGFGLRRLSPKTQLCSKGESCESIPVGGNTSVLLGLELRIGIWRQLRLALFSDAGDVQEGELTYRWKELAVTTGAGLRLDTVVGLFRVDVGCRVNDPPLAATENLCAFYIALGEAF